LGTPHLDMLLQVLRTFEGLLANTAFVWLEGDVDSNMRGDMVALDCSCVALVPATSKVQIVCALPSNMLLTDMVLGMISF